MELDNTVPSVPSALNAGLDAEIFGSRPSSDRPHSMSLFKSSPRQAGASSSRSVDILLGAAAGAAIVYYLDRERGRERRARARAEIERLFGVTPDALLAAAVRATLAALGLKRQ